MSAQVKRKPEEEVDDDEMEASSSSSSEEDEEEDAMRLDAVMEEEGLEDVVFDFDDPQEKHFASIRGLLEQTTGLTGATDGLASIVACDPASVGTVVEVADNEVVCCAATVRLQHYASGANRGVDVVRAQLASAAPATAPHLTEASNLAASRQYALIVRGRMVNVPPKIVAAAYRLFRQDLAGSEFQGFVLLVKPSETSTAPASKKQTDKFIACDNFDDDCFAARASETAPLSSAASSRARLTALYLEPDAFASAVDEIIRLADL